MASTRVMVGSCALLVLVLLITEEFGGPIEHDSGLPMPPTAAGAVGLQQGAVPRRAALARADPQQAAATGDLAASSPAEAAGGTDAAPTGSTSDNSESSSGDSAAAPATDADAAQAPAAAAEEFHWKRYRFYNPELRSNCSTKADFCRHWEEYGREEGRCVKDTPVVFRYPNRAGLGNQVGGSG